MKEVDNIYIINLDKDKERLEKTLNEVKKISKDALKKTNRVQGILGKDIDYRTNYDARNTVSPLFSKIGSKSAIGCALSHIKAWRQMIKNGDETALFLEDDVDIEQDYELIFKNLKIPNDFYIIYLGCTIGCDMNKDYSFEYPITKLFLGHDSAKRVKKINDNVFIPSLPLALHGYILSRKGAEYLLYNIEKDKIYEHIDAQIIKYIYRVPSYSVSPQLIKQQDVSMAGSNNVNNKYPTVLTNRLNMNDKYNIPFNYKITIGLYEILGYTVNMITFFMIVTGLLAGFLNVKALTVLYGFILFTILETYELYKNNELYKCKKNFTINTFTSFFIIMIMFYTVKLIFFNTLS